MPIAVNACHEDILALRRQWLLINALMGGTHAMRGQGEVLLPKWPAEDNEAYKSRLNTATLFPAYNRTVGVMSGKPFAKPLTLKDVPAQIEEWCQDIDLQGVSLHSFSAEMFEEVVSRGLAGILVEYPTTPAADGETQTVAQVQASGARPYLVRVKHNQILGWKSQMVGGRMKLTQLRLLETVEEDDGVYGTVRIEQVRVLTPGGWELHRVAGQNGTWSLFQSGTTTLKDIPYVPLYGERLAFMMGWPPMLDLAYLNTKHWQSQSDQDTILHVARVPILAMIGADDQTQLTVGGASAVKLPIGAEMKFVEHTGAAIEAGANALLALEEQMIQTGAELLVKKPGSRTATETATDAEANKSDLQRIAENFEDGIDQALYFMGQYAGIAKTGTATLFSDYGAATLSDASATLIKDLAMGGLITKETALQELQRRGVLGADVDPATEVANAEAEGPALGTLGLNPEVSAATNVNG
jgi:hypothetical protein